MSIYLGNLSPRQIERRFKFEFTDAERKRLEELWHQEAHFDEGDHGWHMFDMPEFMFVSDGPLGREALAIFQAHSDEMSGSFRGGYACKEVTCQ